MKMKKTTVVAVAAFLLVSSIVPAVMAMESGSQENDPSSIKPSLASVQKFNHVDKLLSFENQNSLQRSASTQVDADATLRQQVTYLKSLNSNDLIETLGELSLYDEKNFERYAEVILPELKQKWDGTVPNEITDIFADSSYSPKFRAFALDTLVSSGQQLAPDNVQQIKDVIQDKSENTDLRVFALKNMQADSMVQARTAMASKEQSFNLLAILQDENEPAEVRAASVTAMRKLNDPNFQTALDMLATTKGSEDDLLLRTLFTSAAHAGILENYGELVQEVLDESNDQELFESAVYAIGVQGGEDAVLTVMNSVGKFSGTGEDIIRFALLSNTNDILSLLDSDDEQDVVIAIQAAEMIYFGEAYDKIKAIHATSNNPEVIQAAEQALKNIDPNELIDPNNNRKWGGQ